MKILFLDESGDHSLGKIDLQYPIFVLGGCIMDHRYHEDVAMPRLRQYKMNLFGRSDFILHTADIVRRKDVFRKLTDQTFREHFYAETNHLMKELDFSVVACGIRKDHHLRQYGIAAIDPYLLSLRCLVERFVYSLGIREEGLIVAEARDETLNNELRLAWIDIRTSGTEYVQAAEIRRKVKDLHIREKSENIAGLQLADLIVSPLGAFSWESSAIRIGKLFARSFGLTGEDTMKASGWLCCQKEGRRPNDSVTAH
jgi:hypothetical protein